MTTVTTRLHPRHMSLAAFMALPESEGRVQELLDGELVVSPKNNYQHGHLCARWLTALCTYAVDQKLGQV